jgi:hypothetical protein
MTRNYMGLLVVGGLLALTRDASADGVLAGPSEGFMTVLLVVAILFAVLVGKFLVFLVKPPTNASKRHARAKESAPVLASARVVSLPKRRA